MKLILSIAAGIILAIVLLAVGCSAMVAGAEGYEAEKVSIENGSKSGTANSGNTSRDNARRSAENYLDTMAFSRKGLIEQLSSSAGEGFSRADATYAVNHVDVNWNEQAAKAAAELSRHDGVLTSGPNRAALVERRRRLHSRAGRVRREPDRALASPSSRLCSRRLSTWTKPERS